MCDHQMLLSDHLYCKGKVRNLAGGGVGLAGGGAAAGGVSGNVCTGCGV